MNSSTPGMLRGIIPPIITPLHDRDTLDIEGLERVVEHQLRGGVHGLFVLGTTGEYTGLSHRLQKEMVKRTCQLAAGRLPVIVGVTDTSIVESVHLAQFAAEQGAQALVLSTPYYVPISQLELAEHFEEVLPELPLPVYLYSIPSFTKVPVELEVVRRLMDQEKIIGLKDSSWNMPYFEELVRLRQLRPDWALFIGPEELLAESLQAGGQGGVCGGANLCPRLFVEIYEAFCREDTARVAALHEQVLLLGATLYKVGAYGSAFLKSIKCAMGILGICSDHVSSPLRKFTGPEAARIEAILADLGITAETPWPRGCGF